MSELSRYGLIGLGVMGRNLAENIVDSGLSLSVYSISAEERAAMPAKPGLRVCASQQELIEGLEGPRTVLLMVTAGAAVDEVLRSLLPNLDADDIVIDGGNSHYQDTQRRVALCAESGVHFVGVGISGGEEGARTGASIMVGGPRERFHRVEPLFAVVAASAHGEPCYGWVGADAAGHFVKAVHNGIEYALMQLIAETYDFMRRGCGWSQAQVRAWFEAQQGGVLDSYLMEITAAIFRHEDSLGDGLLIDRIADVAGQKGTGRWCVDAAMHMGVPIPGIIAAVNERYLSGLVADRAAFAQRLEGIENAVTDPDADENLAATLFVGMLATFAQGLALIRTASELEHWDTDLSTALKLWRGGCIIRATLLEQCLGASATLAEGKNMLLDDTLVDHLQQNLPAMRRVLAASVSAGVPMPASLATLSYIDSLRSERLPTHLIQAQRDYFGAHQYERIDRPGKFHTDW